jgi:hypothetical protein
VCVCYGTVTGPRVSVRDLSYLSVCCSGLQTGRRECCDNAPVWWMRLARLCSPRTVAVTVSRGLHVMILLKTKYVLTSMRSIQAGLDYIPYISILFYVRRKLPFPREPAGAIPKEGTHLYWASKLQGALERQYSFFAESCLVKIHVLF